uniref:Uncharacterized protein n=1 Tax=viral metagenome TaxID=1070528 RepID=A0A6C0LXV2_9ZZZZ
MSFAIKVNASNSSIQFLNNIGLTISKGSGIIRVKDKLSQLMGENLRMDKLLDDYIDQYTGHIVKVLDLVSDSTNSSYSKKSYDSLYYQSKRWSERNSIPGSYIEVLIADSSGGVYMNTAKISSQNTIGKATSSPQTVQNDRINEMKIFKTLESSERSLKVVPGIRVQLGYKLGFGTSSYVDANSNFTLNNTDAVVILTLKQR